MRVLLGIFCAATYFMVGVVYAQPARFNYQAKLTDSQGVPLQGSHTLHFQLYQGGSAGVPNSGTPVFEENQTIAVSNGIVNCAVGEGESQTSGPLTSAMLSTTSDAYLQVSLDFPENVILPRTRFESVPYSLLSANGEPSVPVESLGSSTTATYVISQPGSYYLNGNINGEAGKNGIVINAGKVTLDMHGFSLIGIPGSLNGIAVTGGAQRGLMVTNGFVAYWGQSGIEAISSDDCQFRHIEATGNGAAGLRGASNCTIEDCAAISNGANGDTAGIQVANDCVIRDCVSNYNIATSGTMSGILCGQRCTISGCTCNQNFGGTGSPCDGIGIAAGGFCAVRNNVCSGNQGGTGSPSHGYGIITNDEATIDGNTCHLNTTLGSSVCVAAGISGASNSIISNNNCQFNYVLNGSGANGDAYGIIGGIGTTVSGNNCSAENAKGTGSAVGIAVGQQCRVENNHCVSEAAGLVRYGIRVVGTDGYHTAIIKNTLAQNATAAIRFENTTGTNYHGENLLSANGINVGQQPGGTAVAGTGDRADIEY